MQLNYDEIQQELTDVLEYKTTIEEELLSAHKTEHLKMLQTSIRGLKSREALLKGRLQVVSYDSSLEIDTYRSLIVKRLVDIHTLLDDIEAKRLTQHTEEQDMEIDSDVEFLQAEEVKLATKLYNINIRIEATAKESAKGAAEEYTGQPQQKVISELARTLSTPHGASGQFQMDCMLVASKMIALLMRSHQSGELTDSEYINKHAAVNKKLQFFKQKTVQEFSFDVTAAVLNSSSVKA